MKQLLIVLAVAAVAVGAASSRAASGPIEETEVTAAAAGVFPEGTSFAGVRLRGSTFGLGVLVDSDGSAQGVFHTVLSGTSLAGKSAEISVHGKVTEGSAGSGGTAAVSGTAKVAASDALSTIVPFTVTIATSGLQLTLAGTELPQQTLRSGSIFVEPTPS